MLKFLGVITVSILTFALNCYTGMRLWNWFMVPLGVVSIGALHSFGLAILVKFFTFASAYVNWSENNAYATQRMVVEFLVPLFSLLFGYIIHYFMVMYG